MEGLFDARTPANQAIIRELDGWLNENPSREEVAERIALFWDLLDAYDAIMKAEPRMNKIWEVKFARKVHKLVIQVEFLQWLESHMIR